jgi:hypothetical protein
MSAQASPGRYIRRILSLLKCYRTVCTERKKSDLECFRRRKTTGNACNRGCHPRSATELPKADGAVVMGELLGRACVLGRVLFRLLRAVIAANDDLFTANLDRDPTFLDFPVAHRTFFRLHEVPFELESNARVAATTASDSREGMVIGGEKSDFQILAHFANRSGSSIAANGGWRAAKLPAKGIGEVTVTGKPEFECQCSEIVRARGQSFERGT